jgi:hypothetical protein
MTRSFDLPPSTVHDNADLIEANGCLDAELIAQAYAFGPGIILRCLSRQERTRAIQHDPFADSTPSKAGSLVSFAGYLDLDCQAVVVKFQHCSSMIEQKVPGLQDAELILRFA